MKDKVFLLDLLDNKDISTWIISNIEEDKRTFGLEENQIELNKN